MSKHTNKNKRFPPCICGEFSPGGMLNAPPQNTGANVVFSGSHLSIYQLGDPGFFFTYRERGKRTFVLVMGRIYQPFYLEPGMDEKRNAAVLPYIFDPDLKKLQGSFVIIDYPGTVGSEPRLVIAVDKFGMRTAFYHQNKTGDRVYFATHISGLEFLLGEKMPGLSPPSVIHYYHFGFTSNRETLFKDILKIPPGSVLTIGKGPLRVDKYFALPGLYTPGTYRRMSEHDICREINGCLERAIRKGAAGKKTLAVALSGGVDSGFIAKKAREMGIDVTGYNLAYETGETGGKYNEFNRVERLHKDFDINIKKIIITPGQLIENIEGASAITSEPIGFNDAAMMMLIFAAQGDGFDSLWDGDGVDRLFFGMNRHMTYWKLFKLYNRLNRLKLVPFVLGIIDRLKGKRTEWRKLNILWNNWRQGIPPYPERKLEKNRIYDLDFERFVFNLGIKSFRDSYVKEFPVDDTDDMILYFTYQSIGMCPGMFFHSPGELQQYYGLIPVSPFWNDSMVSLALSIPSYLKVKKGRTKYILRKAASTGDNQGYWMLPKIGLQNSYDLIKNSETGKQWQEEWNKKSKDSMLYSIISEHIKSNQVERKRLLTAYIWMALNNINQQ
jgi:asparagine synthase (glutamine-hydrolysing)